MGLITLTPPSELPLSLEDVKLHLRVDHNDEDELITRLIGAATGWATEYLNRAIIDTQFTYILSAFPGRNGTIPLPFTALQSVDAVRYTDGNGDPQTLDEAQDIQVITSVSPGFIANAVGLEWPPTQDELFEAVEIDYTAGYGARAQVPESVKHALRLILAEWFEFREPIVAGTTVVAVPDSVHSLIWVERIKQVA